MRFFQSTTSFIYKYISISISVYLSIYLSICLSEKTYRFGKTDFFLCRIRWKVYHFLKNNKEETETDNFGFLTLNTPPKKRILYNFESDLY